MTVQVIGNDLEEVRTKIGDRLKQFDIGIRWRASPYNYDRGYSAALEGCVIDAPQLSSVTGHTVPREFASAAEAIKYLREILTKHDEFVLAERDKRKGD